MLCESQTALNYISVYLDDTGTSCKEKFRKENFQTGFVVAGGGFFSYWNHQLIKFEGRGEEIRTLKTIL